MRFADALAPAAILRRLDVRRAFSHDLPLKAAAVAVAIVLYVASAEATPREVSVAFDGRVPVERPESPQGTVLRGTLGEVAVRLRGPASAVEKVAFGDLRATVDLAGLDLRRSEPQELPVRVAAADQRVKVVEVTPATVRLRPEPLTSRALAVQVRFANDPPKGFQPGVATVTPREARVSGAESLVASVAAVYATLRFGDVGVDLTQSAQPVAVDAAATAVEGVRVEPAAVQVSVPILPTATTRTVPVLHLLRGAAASGYWISRVTAEPAAVTVRGEQAALATLVRIETAPIDVSGLSTSRTIRVALALPPGVSLLEPTEATVTLAVTPLTGARPFPLVLVQVTGLASGLAAEVEPRTVEVVLGGEVPALAALASDAVGATVDVSGRAAGTHTLEVTVRAPARLAASVQPSRVTVTIRSRP